MSIYKPSKRNNQILKLSKTWKTEAIGLKFGLDQITVRQIIRDLKKGLTDSHR